MTELEKVEKLREKADVSFAEAKEALDVAAGDILEALIWLENQGKAIVPAGGGFFSGAGTPVREQRYQAHDRKGEARANRGENFSAMMKRLGRFILKMIHKGNTNFLDARSRGGEHMFSCPVTVLVVLLICFFWITVPLFVISLFLGFRYNFSGDDLGRESVNSMMDNASNAIDDIKKNFSEGRHGVERDEDGPEQI